jgi:hypothetical protein
MSRENFWGDLKRMSAAYDSVAKRISNTRIQYNDNRLDDQYSLPTEHVHMGWRNPYKLPYRKSHTAGFLRDGLLEFPETVFARADRLNGDVNSDSPRWIRGFDE